MIKSEDLRLGQPRVLETDNNLILPVHKWIRLLVTGVNVIHSFGLHSLGLRFDGIPGRFNSVSFQFARLGFFRGACMEFCGILHAYMPIKILGVAECIYYQDSQLLILPYLGAPTLPWVGCLIMQQTRYSYSTNKVSMIVILKLTLLRAPFLLNNT
jgi:hypothetical protein